MQGVISRIQKLKNHLQRLFSSLLHFGRRNPFFILVILLPFLKIVMGRLSLLRFTTFLTTHFCSIRKDPASSTKTLDLAAGDSSRDNTLLNAASKGEVDTVRNLIRHKADVRVKTTTVGFDLGQTALHLAANRGYEDIVHILIEAKADVNVKDAIQDTPLLGGISCNSMPIVNALLQAKADPTIPTSYNRTPLHVAASSGYTHMVPLLTAAKANLETYEMDGHGSKYTPLYLAIAGNHTDTVNTLLQAKANPNAESRKYSSAGLVTFHTPLSCAIDNENTEIVRVLLQAKANPTAQEVSGMNRFTAC